MLLFNEKGGCGDSMLTGTACVYVYRYNAIAFIRYGGLLLLLLLHGI